MNPWLFTCGLLAALAWGPLGSALGAHWLWTADHWTVHPWTLWTTSLLPVAPYLRDAQLLMLLATGVIGAWLGARRRDVLALLIAWPLSTLALLMWPGVDSYVGPAGLVHAALGVLAVRIARQAPNSLLSVSWISGLTIKLMLERGWAQPQSYSAVWAANLTLAAHLSGVLAGVLVAALLVRRTPHHAV